ncbi:MAG: exopolyphosphatase [Magnetococcales bacterium]|nr:exopolyphosphatase [Magnetococcales bacterium]
MILAAIDIGSNAVRLLVSNVYEVGDWTPLVRKANLYRVPVRLGEDAFLKNAISPQRTEDLIKTMISFRHLMDVCRVEDYLACATSALRSADNGEEIARRVHKEAHIDLELITGAKEAEYIALNRLDGRFLDGNYLFIDVGGGSTELILYNSGALVAAESFKIGTIRLKEALVSSARWSKMGAWVKKNSRGMEKLRAIGFGGNINKIFKLSLRRQDKALSRKRLEKVLAMLERLTYEERMIKLGLRPDRADVILPAGRIFSAIMDWGGIKDIHVPQIGLADGLIHALYKKHQEKMRLE